jgi:hypothetical protein
MTQPTSLRSHLALLDASGAVSALPVRLPLFSGALVVLARERCVFERLETAKGLNGRAAIAAARLHALTAAPFQKSGAAITHHGSTFGVWWWDAAWVAERLEAAGLDPASKILPEPMARTAGEGWRVARATSGYEAQLWRGGFLTADLWRKRAFDVAGWVDFVRVQPDQAGAENASLSAYDPPFTLRSAYRRSLVSDWTPERTGQAAAALVAIALIVVAGFFLGQAIGLNRSAKALEAQTQALNRKLPRQQQAQGSVADLVALKTELEAPDSLAMLQEAEAVVGPYGFKPLGFTSDGRKVRLILAIEAKDQVSVIASSLEASPYFEDVRPTLDREKGRLIVDMAASGAKKPAPPKPAPAKPQSVDSLR